MSAAGLAGLALAAAWLSLGLVAVRALRRRLELVARAEHELRGPATALGLACQRIRRDPAAARHADVLEAQLDRLRAGLDDLRAARRGGRAEKRGSSLVDLASFAHATLAPWRANLKRCSVDWRAGPATSVTDRGRLAQALGNLLANAAEHGAGDLRLRARRVPGAVRLELRNGNRTEAGDVVRADRGRGLAIAARATRQLGGRLLVHTEEAATVAVLELPERPPAPGRARRDVAEPRAGRPGRPPAAGRGRRDAPEPALNLAEPDLVA